MYTDNLELNFIESSLSVQTHSISIQIISFFF